MLIRASGVATHVLSHALPVASLTADRRLP